MAGNFKKLLLRTCSYKGYGSGHLKRTILLAKKIIEIYGNNVELIIAIEGDEESFGIVKKSKIKYIKLPLGIKVEDEIENYFPKNIDILVLDLFDRNDSNEKEYKKVTDCLVTFLDMGGSSIYSDIIIYPQLLPDSTKKSKDEQIVLEGTDYFIFDDNYLSTINRNRSFNKKKYSIFVCLGGYSVDPVLRTICHALASNISILDKITFITGHCCSVDIRKIIKNNYSSIEIIEYCDNPLRYLTMSDFAIISGGHIKYEAAALGVPSIIISLVKHQDVLSKTFEKTGSCVYLGPAESVNSQNISEEITKLIMNGDKLISMSRFARNTIDGHGAERVARSIFSLY